MKEPLRWRVNLEAHTWLNMYWHQWMWTIGLRTWAASKAAIFRDAAIATCIFLNDAAKTLLDERIAADKLPRMSLKASAQRT